MDANCHSTRNHMGNPSGPSARMVWAQVQKDVVLLLDLREARHDRNQNTRRDGVLINVFSQHGWHNKTLKKFSYKKFQKRDKAVCVPTLKGENNWLIKPSGSVLYKFAGKQVEETWAYGTKTKLLSQISGCVRITQKWLDGRSEVRSEVRSMQ